MQFNGLGDGIFEYVFIEDEGHGRVSVKVLLRMERLRVHPTFTDTRGILPSRTREASSWSVLPKLCSSDAPTTWQQELCCSDSDAPLILTNFNYFRIFG